MSSIPPVVVATALVETMKLVQELARERGIPVSEEFLAAQEDAVNAVADEANELNQPLPHDQ